MSMDLRTPAEWAEHFGITGLVPEEWQDSRGHSGDTTPLWEARIPEHTFRYEAEGYWTPPADPDTGRRQVRASRTAVYPKFAPDAAAIIDLLATQDGWRDTSFITETLARPLGFGRNNIPSNSRVTRLLGGLVADGTVQKADTSTKEPVRRIPGAYKGATSWILTSRLEELVADRDADEAEHDRRRVKLEAWLTSIDPVLAGEGGYAHRADIMVVDGVLDPERDTGRCTIDWSVVERVIDATGVLGDG